MIAPAIGPETELQVYYTTQYERLKLAAKSINTKRLYRITLAHFDRYHGRPATLADLNDDNLTAHLGWLRDEPETETKPGRKRAPRTANKSRDQLLAIWRFAARKRHVESFPDVDQHPEYKRTPVAYTVDQVSHLLSIVRTCAGRQIGRSPARPTIDGIPTADWWVALLLLLYDTGIRVGAALQLTLADYDPTTHRLIVQPEYQKQREGQSFVVSDQTAAALLAIIQHDPRRGKLFPWPPSIPTLYNHLGRLLKLAGLPSGRADKFHKFRKTSATMAEIHCGAGSASAHLGHSSPRVTANYIDLTQLPETNIATRLPRPAVDLPVAPSVPTAAVFSIREAEPLPPKATTDDAKCPATPLGRLLTKFVDTIGSSRHRARSGQTNQRRIERTRIALILNATGAVDVPDLDAARVLAYLASLTAAGYSPVTVTHYRRTFTRFVGWLVKSRQLAAAAPCLVGLSEGGVQ